MISIYGSPRSSSGRCFWCLEEVGISYEAKSVSFKERENKSEAYLELNPNGKVPVLVDGDFKIWESMAINFYLADKYKPELLGRDPMDRGLVQQWTIWSIAELQAPIIDIFIQLVFVPEERRNLEFIKKAQEKLPKLLDVLEKKLSAKQYLVSESFTLADLNTASVVNICRDIKFDISNYENIKSWLGRVGERAAFKKYQELCSPTLT